MTDRELMQQALEALEKARDELEEYEALAHAEDYNDPRLNDTIAALRERLAQPEQEPVAWGMRRKDGDIYDCISPAEHARHEGSYTVPLYTTQPRREWRGLTEEEFSHGLQMASNTSWMKAAKWVEAKLREKNHV